MVLVVAGAFGGHRENTHRVSATTPRTAAIKAISKKLEMEDLEPDPPALGASLDCPACHGCGVIYSKDLERVGWLYPRVSRVRERERASSQPQPQP